MNSDNLDVCWISPIPRVPFMDDARTLQILAETSNLRVGVAWIGQQAALDELSGISETRFLDEVPSKTGEPRAPSDEEIAAMKSLLQRLRFAIGVEDEVELLIELGHLLMHLGPHFRATTFWRHPSIIQEMVLLNREGADLGMPVTDQILIANELLESFAEIVSKVQAVPKAKIYHAVRGSYAGLIAAFAAEHYNAHLIFTESLCPADDLTPFWLHALPQHWQSSLAQSTVYRTLGEHVLTLTQGIVARRSQRYIKHFSFTETPHSPNIRPLFPALATTSQWPTSRRDEDRELIVGWAMPTLSLESLNSLSALAKELDPGSSVRWRLIEAAPHRRGWICDHERWLESHPEVAKSFEGIFPYEPSELSQIDLLVGMPNPNLTGELEVGFEELHWLILHALSAGVPIIAGQAFEPWFANQSQEPVGLFLPDESAESFADALRALFNDPTKQEELGRNAKALMTDSCSQIKLVDAYRKLYENTLEVSAPQQRSLIRSA